MRRSILPLLAILAWPVAGAAQETAVQDEDAPVAAVLAPAPVEAPSAEQSAFTLFVAGLRDRALAEGVKPETFDRETLGLEFDPRVVRLDRSQPGGGPSTVSQGPLDFAPYRRQHVGEFIINRGRGHYQSLATILQENERKSGVPGKVALSIFGHETGYGNVTGRFDILRSFASLAFEGRRRELFTAEFIATLKLIDRGFARSQLKGSWAGATGYPQFLPSTYLRLGTDGDGDGRADIWSNRSDALASIAAYLNEAGWKPNTPWGVAVTVPSGFDRAAIRSPLTSPRCPRVHARLSRWLTMAEWKERGIAVAGWPAPADSELVSLIEPDGPDATAYLLTSNYRVILDYNCSNFYALAVGLLADEVAR